MTEKLTLEIAMKYPKARIVSEKKAYGWRDIAEYLCDDCINTRNNVKTIDIDDCKLILRPLSSLTDEEKKYIIAQWLNETLDKWTNLDEVFALIFDTCSFEDIIRFIDYVRSLNVDVETPSLQERGIAEYE